MYRPRRSRKNTDDMNLDSLMDVLSCSVGVMLFIVIFAVIEAKGTNVLVYSPPLSREPPDNSSRILALCVEGKVRILDAGTALQQLIGDVVQLTYEGVPGFVSRANRKNVSDGNFSYRLVYRDESYGEFRRKRVISLRVDEKPGVHGDSSDDLVSAVSVFERALAGFDREEHWLAFGVDADSVEVFREARAIAMEKGFATGWDPIEIEFPYEEVVLGGGSRKQVEGKPRSGLGIIQ
jgi:hypothetical protein